MIRNIKINDKNSIDMKSNELNHVTINKNIPTKSQMSKSQQSGGDLNSSIASIMSVTKEKLYNERLNKVFKCDNINKETKENKTLNSIYDNDQ